MLAASQVLPLAAKFCRQIVPPVVATLIAAGLISAYNHAFSGHLTQPRMSALHAAENAAPQAASVTTVGMTKPPPAPVTETITINEEETAPERLWDKEANEQSGKDQTAVKLAEPAPAPVRAAQAPRIEPKYEPRPDLRYEPRYEQRRVAAVELPPPVVRAPAPVIVAVPPSVVSPPTVAPVVSAMPEQQQQLPQSQPQPQYQQQQQQAQPQYQPPPVIMGTQGVVTVPDKPVARPVEEAQAEPARPQGAIGTFVNVFKPSNWFARAREFGEKIEAAGNDILPNIRQQ